MRVQIAANTACAIALALGATTGSFGQSTDGQQASMTFFITSVGLGKGADLGGLAGQMPTARRLRRRQALAPRPGARI